MKNDKQIAEVTPPAIVMPSVSPAEAVAAWNSYQALKKAIVTSDDVQLIQGKEFYKKSYWRKIATFFNLSIEITEQREETLEGDMVYHFTQKAIAPNGRYAYGVGSCNLMEKGRCNTIHNARGTAETRAFNRAVSNLVGGGEVSAEEIDEVKYPSSNVSSVSEPVKTQILGLHEEVSKKEDVPVVEASPLMISREQKTEFLMILPKKGKTQQGLNQYVKDNFNVDTYQDLTHEQAERVLRGLRKAEDKVTKKKGDIESEQIATEVDEGLRNSISKIPVRL